MQLQMQLWYACLDPMLHPMLHSQCCTLLQHHALRFEILHHAFCSSFQPLLSMLKVMLCVTGNDSGGECGVATARRFIMPEAYLDAAQQEAANHGSSVNSPFWYSFDYGSVHFVMLSTEHDVTPGSHQYRVGLCCHSYSS